MKNKIIQSNSSKLYFFMCGIIGIYLSDDNRICRGELYSGLLTLQHRGQGI